MFLSNGAPDIHFAEAPSAIRKNALAEAAADASCALLKVFTCRQELKNFVREIFCILKQESVACVRVKDQLRSWCVSRNREAMLGWHHDVRNAVTDQDRHSELREMRPCRAISLPP